MRSQGIRVLTKHDIARAGIQPGRYLVQEFINTTAGMPEIGVAGMHNIRTISVGGRMVGSIARIKGKAKDILKDDVYGAFIDNKSLPASMHAIVDAVHTVLKHQPGHSRNTIAIDMMRGLDGKGEQVDVLCEVNRRPARISPYNLLKPENLDEPGILRLGKLWDKAEAALLARYIA
jgi:glutathione synthase/RimK-type ligase-like ATP-grasp enzyme